MTEPIRVVSAIIVHPATRRILLAQRCVGDAFPLMWETPGGKVEGNERGCDALKRELIEELDWPLFTSEGETDPEIRIADEPFMIFHLDPSVDGVRFPIAISFFACSAGRTWVPQLLEAVGCGWFTIKQAMQLDMTPGTRRAIERLLQRGLPHGRDWF